jgi:hypothetical protein
MKQTPGTFEDAADKLLRRINRKTLKRYWAEEKIRVVLAGLRREKRSAVPGRGISADAMHSLVRGDESASPSGTV